MKIPKVKSHSSRSKKFQALGYVAANLGVAGGHKGDEQEGGNHGGAVSVAAVAGTGYGEGF